MALRRTRANNIDLHWEFAATLRRRLPRGTRFIAQRKGLQILLRNGSRIAVIPASTGFECSMRGDGTSTTHRVADMNEVLALIDAEVHRHG